jgi:hypothetical protein
VPLQPLDIAPDPRPLPDDVRAFLDEAGRRIERFQRDHPIGAFVASDSAQVYCVLRTLANGPLPGNLFCEWGSGIGVVAGLASLLGFVARGIEREPLLVAAARQLAADFRLPVEFACGSFLPPGAADAVDAARGPSWLAGGDRLGPEQLEPADADVVFAYPWPAEERAIAALFERLAAAGTVLVTYHHSCDLQVRRRTSGSAGRRR